MRIFYLAICLMFGLNSLAGQVFDPSLVYFNNDGGVQKTVATADLDGDGYEDMIITGANPNVAWLKNNANQSFGPKITLFDDEIFGEAAVPIDLDKDGDMDIIAACAFANIVVYIENNGNGTFKDAVILEQDLEPLVSLIVEDLDDDGDLDVLFSDWSILDDIGRIFLLENINNTLHSKRLIANDVFDAEKIVVSNIDNDGLKDIVTVTDHDNKMYWFKNEGSLNFAAQIISDSSFTTRTFAVADVDLDGDNDIVQAHGDLSLWENDGSGNFTSTKIYENSAWELEMHDFNNDGYPDIFLGEVLAKHATLLINDGNGGFDDRETYLSDIGIINSIWITDINTDGKADVFTSSSLYDGYHLFVNISTPSGLQQVEEKPYRVYPNPADDVVIVEGVHNEASKLELMSLSGQVLSTTNTNRISLQSFQTGIYILRIIEENGLVQTELVHKQ